MRRVDFKKNSKKSVRLSAYRGKRKLTEFLGLKEDSIDWTGIQEDTR
jgi:hypothetical protein